MNLCILFINLLLILSISIEAQSKSPFSSSIQELRDILDKKNKTVNPESKLEILNVSYDPTRELYNDIDKAFAAWWKDKTGQEVIINQSHGGSGTQARAVSQGLQADVVSLALALDIDAIHKNTQGIIPEDWAARLPNNSVPFTSTVIFLVREGNPKKIKDWDDLVREGISIIIPNPKTSGGARWIYLAAWGYASKKYQGDEEKTKQFMAKLFKNVPTLDTGARGATTTFVQRGIGDVLLTWENEAHLAIHELGNDKFDIVIPSISIKAEPPVAWIDKVIDKKGTREVAEYYLAYLYTPEAQEIAAKHFFRPIDREAAARYSDIFPSISMLDIEQDFGGWKKAQEKHFSDGGTFDQIYLKK